MISFGADDLLDALDALARKEQARIDRKAVAVVIADALAEAEQLAERRPEHEPAALCYAFGRRSFLFRAAARAFVEAILRGQAVACNCEVEITEVEFRVLSARLALGQIEFPELRDWLAPRLRPLGQKAQRKPPTRPR